MKRSFAALVLLTPLFAQEADPGIVRGTVVQADNGMLQIRQASGSPSRCGFDAHTWIERDRQRLTIGALENGVSVEALTDKRAGRCYTRIIRLISAEAAVAPVPRRTAPSQLRNPIESIYPRGNLTFSGVVLRRSPTLLVVRTRTEPEKMIVLREDTRYLDSGTPTTSAQLAVNTRVFIRGGKNFENTLEAYQVVWGEIDGPKTDTSR